VAIISSVLDARDELGREPLDLEALVSLVNELLPRYLPAQSADKAAVSVRLARYFQTHGLLDEPFKTGREARYGARHLLQLLAVRRLMAQGYSTSSLSNLLRGASDDALQRLIEGEAPGLETLSAPALPPTSSNAALDFLSGLRARSPAPSSPAPAPPVPTPAPGSSEWTRHEIAPSLEVHTRDDFSPPNSPHEWDVLIESFKQSLLRATSPSVKRRRK